MSEKPKFVPVDLTEMMDEGVLMAANERFFWPLGLALTWDVPDGAEAREAAGEPTGPASNLHIREWRFEDEHHEGIEMDPLHSTVVERRARFEAWWVVRVASMPVAERQRAATAKP